MPQIHRHECNQCGLELPSGWGGHTYVQDPHGHRIICPHPGEGAKVRDVTGLDMAAASQAGLVGLASNCICGSCFEQFDLDLERDSRKCPACASQNVCSVQELIDHPCPRCKTGLIKEVSPIRWKLDPGWETLPVPEIVKQLVQFHNDRVIPDSLKPAASAADQFRENMFFLVILKMLDWWEGDFLSDNTDPKESLSIHPGHNWLEAFLAVVELTPGLRELIEIRNHCCFFVDQVSPDVRRGIKNHVRKHLECEVWT